jgi:trehalose/maltose hydrolase-like predicted phosphorylase
VAGQVAELDRLVAVARADTREGDPAPAASAALARSRALGWRAVLAGHEAAWRKRWIASDILIDGDDEAQRAVRFAVYHLTSAANPADDRVSIGARGLTGDAYLGHVFWDTEIFLLPFYTAVWPEAARALLKPLPHPARRAGEGGAFRLQGRALRLGIRRHRRGDYAGTRDGIRWRAGGHIDRPNGTPH